MDPIQPNPLYWPNHTSERVLARADWVPACEATIGLRGIEDFLAWMDRYVRPLLSYRVMICGTGVFMPQTISIDQLLLRGIRADDVERLRDEAGTIALPRGRALDHQLLRAVELTSLTQRVWDGRAPIHVRRLCGSSMEQLCQTRQRGSYFLFGTTTPMVQTHSAYGMQLLAPHMHEALLSALRQDRRGVDERAPFRLSRTEMQLLSGLVAGQTTEQIALTSFRSRHTIANQIRSIIKKLNAKNRTEAISKALGCGLIDAVERSPRTRIIAAQPIASYQVKRKALAWRGKYRRVTFSSYDGPFTR